MYQYDQYDQRAVSERAAQFLGQVERRLSGEILEDEFKPLRLQNGLYMQLHGYMLRVAIPYGLLSSKQIRKFAHIARKFDKGYAHLTTRQNLQYNWLKLQDVPEILRELASVEMHAVQTSGNCIRNTTSDQFAGVARDEVEDPRPYAELIRQWSTFHPEFAFLPRKFKIAIAGTDSDRAAIYFHDIGVRIVRGPSGETGFQMLVGGGLGRTPFVAKSIRENLPKQHLLSYLEAILRVYNMHGRRDNKFKARIKILVDALGAEEFGRQVDAEWEHIKDSALQLTDAEVQRVAQYFAPQPYEKLPESDAKLEALALSSNRDFGRWVRNNVTRHRQPGYCAVTISVKHPDVPPGDLSDTQMDSLADLADRYSFGEARVTHRQNLVFADVRVDALEALYKDLAALDLGTANSEKVSDVICCPGLDYCDLANARSIPVAMQIMQRFTDVDYIEDLGDVSIKMSGCINACGHHHAGNIGILGIDKQGEEFYQLMLGGSADYDASIGSVLGKAFPKDKIVEAVATVLDTYLKIRESADETFLMTYRRLGAEPFKKVLYGDN
jgi:sulfite reductase (NADPH) hemoprotein beta-component